MLFYLGGLVYLDKVRWIEEYYLGAGVGVDLRCGGLVGRELCILVDRV